MLFSHEPLEVYYTLTQKGGNGSATVQITGNDLQENTNREKAQEAARKIRADLPDTVSVRYSYDVSYRQDILGNSALPNGEYTYRLTA